MQIRVALTVQARGQLMRFYNCMVEAERLPQVGDTVAVGRYPGTSPGSSPLTARVTAVQWEDVTFSGATLFLDSDNEAVNMESLDSVAAWVDEEA